MQWYLGQWLMSGGIENVYQLWTRLDTARIYLYLHIDDTPGGQMGDPHSRLGFVDTLASSAL